MRISTLYFHLTTSTVLTFCFGCRGPVADYSRVELIDGRGTIKLDGQPLVGAVVTFEDASDATFSYGLTDSKGFYQLQFDSEMKGVKVGKKVVRISTNKKILGLNSKPGGEEGEPAKAKELEQVPEVYNKKSELSVTVDKTSGPFNFDLKR